MVMNLIRVTFLSLMVGLPSVAAASGNTFIAFGLTNAPLGDAQITIQGETILVSSPNSGSRDLAAQGPVPAGAAGIGQFAPGSFGVSIQLGEADSGIWAYPYHNGYFNDGAFLIGEAFGEVDGQPDQPVCALLARRESEGNHSVQADFSMIGAPTQVFEIYSGETLMISVTNAGGAAIIHTYGESGPRANPFWRLRDGSIASVVELSGRAYISLPGNDDTGAYGDRLIIRAVSPASQVSFVSRVDVTGGGLSHFLITEARLGMFYHAHLALGPTLLNAAGGKLQVANSGAGTQGPAGPGHGVAIELEGLSRFDVSLLPLDLGSNGTITAGAVATVNQIAGEFLGYAGVRSSNGVLSAFASLSALEPEMEIAVYHDGCLAGSAQAASSLATVGLSGNPKITSLGATTQGLRNRAGLAITLAAATAITLPGGAVMDGNEIRFQASAGLPIDRLTSFHLLVSDLSAFTIWHETTPQTLSLDDYIVDLRAGASIKRFIDGQGNTFTRSVTITNRGPDASGLIRVSDTSSNAVAVDLFSFQTSDLFYHGGGVVSQGVDTFSVSGVRLLPKDIRLGQSYVSTGTFLVWDPDFENLLTQTTTLTTRAAAFETLTVPAGRFNALRIESTEVSTIALPDGGTAQFVVLRTNWLVAGLGVAQFSIATDERVTSGSLIDYSVITSEPREFTAHVGASVVFDVTVNTAGNVFSGNVEWRRDGTVVANNDYPSLSLQSLTTADAGSYSVTVSNASGVVTGEIGSLNVVRFSDPACFWAQRANGTRVGYGEEVFARRVLLDANGNTYVLGVFSGPAIFGPFTLNSAGGYDIFLAKLSPTGEYISAIQAGGAHSQIVTAGEFDAAGNLYIAGTFNGTAVLGNTTLTGVGSQDMFIAKLDSTGNFQWAVRAGGGNYEYLSDLGVDSSGNVYVTGTYDSDIQFGNILVRATGSGSDLFLAKLNTSGNFLWARGISSGSATALAVEPGGDVYVTGARFIPSLNHYVGFLTRASANGEFLWLKEIGSGQYASDVAVDSLGNVLLTGTFNGLASFGKTALSTGSASPWYPQSFLAKLDPTGDFLWARKLIGGAYSDVTQMAVDQQGNSYVYNQFYSTAEVGTARFVSGPMLLLSKLDPFGHTLWVKQFGGSSPRAVAADASGNAYVIGAFGQSARFGDFVLNSPIPNGTTYNNMFVAKICAPPPPAILTQPQSLTVNAGASASFNVGVTNAPGAPVSFQWRKDGVIIPGATGDTLSIADVQAAHAGDYTVMVNSEGGSVSSSPAALTVNSPFAGSISFSSATYSVFESAGIALIEVTRSGSLTGLVTVEFVTANGTAEANMDYLPSLGTLRFADGESVKTFDVPITDDHLFEGSETVILRLCHATGGAVLGAITNAMLTIENDDPPAPVIISHPHNAAVGNGTHVAFTVVVSGQGPFYYQWRRNNVNIPGANDPTYIIASTQSGDAAYYSVLVTNSFGEAVSRNASLTVYPGPVIHEQPGSLTVARGTDVLLSVVASGFNTVTQIFDRASGVALEDRFVVDVRGRAGRLVIDYDFFTIPDSLTVYVHGIRMFDTGLTNGFGTIHVLYARSYYFSGAVEVVVNEGGTNHAGTAWNYQLRIIPETLHHQWLKDGAIIPGATDATLFLPYVTDSSAGHYTVTVSDTYGFVVSDPATLTIIQPASPVLHFVRLADGRIQLSWDAPNFLLETAADLGGPWQYHVDLGATSFLVTPGEGNQFFRLRENFAPSGDD